MRWRTKGTVAYTDGITRPWQVPPSLLRLLFQVNEAYPLPHPTDGTVAGRGHYLNSPKSDHTPDLNGWVRAADIGEVVENDAFAVAEAVRLSRDPRIKYVIHELRMYSSYNHPNGLPYTWRPYSGSNPHKNHAHFSVYRINQNDITEWNIGYDPRGGDNMPLNELDKATVDIAYALGAQFDRTYWYGLDRNNAEFQSLGRAVREKADNLLDRIAVLERQAEEETVALADHGHEFEGSVRSVTKL